MPLELLGGLGAQATVSTILPRRCPSAARLCAARPGVPVILTSPDAATVERARRHTPLVRAVLLKPYSTDALRAAAAEALGPEG